ncbi:MAG: PhnD/SsuA/transferrin family substrate-binding protein [Arcobacteraceae bacterium]|nr:PhnD/SsuA/transferrin family substrate-binding protein [Arcobacteraceae bacterium]
MKSNFLIFLMICILYPMLAISKEVVIFGILENRTRDIQPNHYDILAKYLNDNLEDFEIKVKIMKFDEINEEMNKNQIDFLMTSPLHYIQLKERNFVSSTIATLVYTIYKNYSSNLGATFIVPSSRDDITTMEDFKDKKIATMGKGFFAAYDIPIYEFYKKGIILDEENFVITSTHKDFIQAILSGKADVGFARSGVIEKLIELNLVNESQIKYINEQNINNFPYKISTPLYPEMPIIATTKVDINLIRDVASLLFAIRENHPVSQALNIGGFIPPADYTIIDQLAKDLKLPPYDKNPHIRLNDIWQQYSIWILLGVLIFVVLISLLIYIILINKRIEQTREMYIEQKNRLLSIIEFIPDLLWMKDVEGKYIICNRRFEQLYATPQKDIIGKTDYDFVSKELSDFFKNHDNYAMNSPFPCTNIEELTFAIDGHTELIQTTKTFIKDSRGNKLGVLGIGRDITKLKEQELKLQEQKQELQEIFHTTKDGIAILDSDSKFLKVNQAYIDITGLSEDELLATSCIELSIEDDKEKSKDIIDRVLNGEIMDSFEKHCLIKDKIVTVSISLALMPNKTHLLASIKDISYLKAIERQAKLASMGEMIANIAHQWRQPLSVISVVASGIKLRQEFGEIQGYNINEDMDEIVNQTNYLSKTIDDFRNFIKEDNISTFELQASTLINKTLSLLKSSFTNHHIAVDVDIKDDPYIDGYENELVQSLINIINNAKDAIKEHVPIEEDRIIFIKTRKINNTIEISVIDNGGGIDPQIIPRLYEPYFTTKHQSVGTGLGLPMAYQIITQRHHGDLRVQNYTFEHNGKIFRGAKFTIILNLSNEREKYEK